MDILEYRSIDECREVRMHMTDVNGDGDCNLCGKGE